MLMPRLSPEEQQNLETAKMHCRRVMASRQEIRAAKIELGRLLVELRPRYPYGTWIPFLYNQGFPRKLAESSIDLYEQSIGVVRTKHRTDTGGNTPSRDISPVARLSGGVSHEEETDADLRAMQGLAPLPGTSSVFWTGDAQAAEIPANTPTTDTAPMTVAVGGGFSPNPPSPSPAIQHPELTKALPSGRTALSGGRASGGSGSNGGGQMLMDDLYANAGNRLDVLVRRIYDRDITPDDVRRLVDLLDDAGL